MQYPLISEYLAAIREAKDNLDKLSHLVPVLDKYGEPYRSSGAFAVVFKMKDEQTGKCYALKCFTEEQEGRVEAYHKIAEELEFVDSPYITSVKYLEKEIFVDSNCEDEEFPVLLMDWIEGETMETYIAANYTDTHAMSMLCYRFCKMAAWLRSQSFAHGDIKPDNIMVRPDGTLTLVDYDGMFVPAMKGQKSPTIGTKDFSHPLRTVDDFDETIDDFALASIALSLKAISLNPSLLQTYGASDRLLFSASDYLDLSKSNTFTALQSLLTDDEAITLMSMFLLASAKKDLSMCSFRLFGVQKPKEEEVCSTEVTKEDLENAVEDAFGVKYSKDWKRLLKAPSELKGEYYIRKGVKVIGNNALGCCESLTSINIPNSVTNIGDEAFVSKYDKNKANYVNTFSADKYEDESDLCKEIRMLEAMFHVSAPTQIYKHWLNAVLYCISKHNNTIEPSLLRNRLYNLACSFMLDIYIGKEKTDFEDIVYGNNEFLPSNRIEDIDWSQIDCGCNVNNFIFNFYDFVTWRKNPTKYPKFEFSYRTSVEHFYPQNPMPGYENLKDKGLDNFGNLCLISRGMNSKFSNNMPKAKLDNFGLVEEVRNGLSLKLLEMMDIVKKDEDWGEQQIHEFEKLSKERILEALKRN